MWVQTAQTYVHTLFSPHIYLGIHYTHIYSNTTLLSNIYWDIYCIHTYTNTALPLYICRHTLYTYMYKHHTSLHVYRFALVCKAWCDSLSVLFQHSMVMITLEDFHYCPKIYDRLLSNQGFTTSNKYILFFTVKTRNKIEVWF